MTEKRHVSDGSSTNSGDPLGMPWDDCVDILVDVGGVIRQTPPYHNGSPPF